MALPKIDVTIVGFNEEQMLPYALRHYSTFARRIRYWDAFSTDGSRDIAKSFGAEIYDWHTDGVNDLASKTLKSTDWMYPNPADRADWHIVCDTDELVYFPKGAEATLAAYDKESFAIIKTKGFEMLSDFMPTGTGQIYDEVQYGGDDDNWYGKPALFAPHRLAKIDFSAGAHEVTGTFGNGQTIQVGFKAAPNPPQTYLLHFHHLGGLQRVADRYDAQRRRLSALNVQNRWGNFDPGMKHAQDKRAFIMQTYRKII